MHLQARHRAAREDGQPSGVIFVAGGTFRMGSDRFYSEKGRNR